VPLFKSLSSNKSPQEYKIVVWRISEEEQELKEGLELSSHSQTRLSQMKSASQRSAFLAVRQLIQLLGYSDHQLSYNENGKPFLEGVESVSISHTTQYAAVAVGYNCHMGVDIERHREQIERIAPKFCGPGAVRELTDRTERIEKLTAIWGAKEAVYKIVDRPGLSFRQDIRIDDFVMLSKHSSAWTDTERFHFSFDSFDHHTLVYAYMTKPLS